MYVRKTIDFNLTWSYDADMQASHVPFHFAGFEEDGETERHGRTRSGYLLVVQILGGPATNLSNRHIMCRFRASRYAPGGAFRWLRIDTEKEPGSETASH